MQKANLIPVMINELKYNNTNIFRVLLRYFEPSKRVQVKVLEFKLLPRESVDIATEFLASYLSRVNSRDKTICLCR
jgi:hypothetical protein